LIHFYKRVEKMASSGIVWTPNCSLTALKYQRYGFVRPKPFIPGDRLRARREMDKTVKGYKSLRNDLAEVRVEVKRQKERCVLQDRIIRTSFYKSPVGTRTVKGPGKLFYTDFIPRSTFFCMKRVWFYSVITILNLSFFKSYILPF